MYSNLYETLKNFNQEHLLRFWDDLDESEQENLAKQINEINWDVINELISSHDLNQPKVTLPRDISAPNYYPLKAKNKTQSNLYKEAKEKGIEILSNSEVAAFTVAGGQGTRLGYDGPKGTFPITPIKNKTLFQYFAESIKNVSEKYNACIPWYIMTSMMNYNSTVSFFEENNFFELDRENIKFFKQGTMPAIGKDGKILLASKSSLALSPDGHGGSLLALKRSGAMDEMKSNNIKYISYFQVDNPLVTITNPLFIGLHALEKAEMSAIMLSKTGPNEKLGNFCKSEGRLQIIEYSDMPAELAEKRDEEGNLVFIAGSPAIHILSNSFIESLTEGEKLSLPWHKADKKVEYIDDEGKNIKPELPNAIKLESFIFDALPLAEKTTLLEAARESEFAPVKNREGIDSVESCREMLIARDANLLEEYGDVEIPRKFDSKPDCVVELSPLSYLDGEDIYNNLKIKEFVSPKAGDEVYYE